ncbi:MAG: carbon starvation protein A [Bdellovibrionia bacterium]
MQGFLMKALPFILGALCVLVIFYRYYSAFLAAKVLSLDDSRVTPAHALEDHQNYVPTPRWVLFGHHFAAITGAGPLIGPVLAAQFGFLPGYLWLVIGVVIGGAVHDFVILTASVRHQGKSIAEIAQKVMGPWAGRIVGVAILFIVVIALAGLGLAVVNALEESAWGTFTLASTIPIGLFMGLSMGRSQKNRVKLTTALGVITLIAAVIFGKSISQTAFGQAFSLSRESLILSIAGYGFLASVLPVWLLLCPRDYLSSFMKIGTIGGLTLAVILVNPELHMPMISQFVEGGGPILPGRVFPFVFITIACGAISGFHSLIASGTTPKMISTEGDCRVIGYGAMIFEGWVGLTSLIAASALFPEDYFAINVSAETFSQLGMSVVNLPELSEQVGEAIAGRPGGAVSLAVGMAQVFSSVGFLKDWMSYWYHFAILFEALFILTTIDAGTRVARFLVQEFFGRLSPKWGEKDWLPGSLVSTGVVVLGWSGLIWTGSVSTLWPLFGIANQLLASIALIVGSLWLIQCGKLKYVWVTAVPFVFVMVTTVTAGIQSIGQNFLPLVEKGERFTAYLSVALVGLMLSALGVMICIAVAQLVQLFKLKRISLYADKLV